MKIYHDEKSFKKQIPSLTRNGPRLISRLMIVALVGFDSVLDSKGRLYFRLICRLTDYAYDEYNIAKSFISKEIETQNPLDYRFDYINHMEACLNAISRTAKTFRSAMKDNSDILKYISGESLEKIKNFDNYKVRNRL